MPATVRQLILVAVFLLGSIAGVTFAQSEDCALEPRLIVGQQARLTTNTPSRVRAAPSVSAEQIGQIQPVEIVTVLDGPVCADGIHWFQIQLVNLIGWVAEGVGTDYFTEPVIATPAPQAPTGAPNTTPTPVPTDCALPPRLVVGMQGRLTTRLPSRVRAEPSTSAEQVGQIQPVETFSVVDGPVCGEGIQWFQIQLGVLEGWTAEGIDGEYIIEPIAATATPPPTSTPRPAATPTLTPTPEFIGLPDPVELSWNSDGSLIAVGTAEDGIYLFDTTDWGQPPTRILEGSNIQSLTFDPNDPQMLAVSMVARVSGCLSSSVRLILLNIETLQEVLEFRYEDEPCFEAVTQLQFTADGSVLSSNTNGVFRLYDAVSGQSTFGFGAFYEMCCLHAVALSADGTHGAVMTDVEHETGDVWIVSPNEDTSYPLETWPEEVTTALAVSADGNLFYAGGEHGSLKSYSVGLYTVNGATVPVQVLDTFTRERSGTSNQINALALDSQDRWVATAESDPYAVIRVFNSDAWTPIGTYFGGPDSLAALDVEFSPDGALLAALIDDTVHIIDTSDWSRVAVLVAQRN